MKTKSTRRCTLPYDRNCSVLLRHCSFYFLLLMMSCVASGAFAQSFTVTGKVADETGESLPGVNVIVKGTMVGQTTDAEGNYAIDIPDNNKVLIFSYVGFLTKEIIVGNETVVNV